ncbi:MAG: hypothetical protein EOO07_28515 [Chitinophagaceae bacterium]|nr:MAG: hypothetical protein EOO07_28515 [Chitinophagaceae bacterium]
MEQVIEALLFFGKADFELHLLGKVSKEIEHFFMQTLKGKNLNIKFHEPISPQDLVPFASHFDIGLATELSQPMNRDICLTNKVFTYIQSGLAIIASKTSAQSSLFGQYPNMGMMVEILNTQSIVLALKSYLGDKDLLNSHKTNALLHADKELNWESEESIFLSVIEKTLNDEALKNP